MSEVEEQKQEATKLPDGIDREGAL